MYTVRLLDQAKALLAVLPVISWSYDRKISTATGIMVKIARKEISSDIDTTELFAFLTPPQPSVQEAEDTSLTAVTPVLAYYLQLYRDTDVIGMGIIAKRDFTDTTITLKAHTEEYLLSLYRTPADYGIIYDNTDICDLARDMLNGWRTIRFKQNWDGIIVVTNGSVVDTSQIDIATEPSVVILDKDGAGVYFSTGYMTFEFSQPDDFAKWERIRWSADNEDPVYSTMAYRTWNGAIWSAWSAEYEGALPDQLGIEIGVTDAVKVQVRITLTTDDQTSEDAAGNPVGSTPALFAVEIIARTTAFLTGSIPVASTDEVVNLDADEKTSLQVLREACEQVGWEFKVISGVLTIAEAIGSDLEVLFRVGTNVDITQLGDDAAEIINYLIANGTGSGINRPQVTLKDAASITSYGVRQLVKNFDISDPTDLETAAQAYLDSVADPFYSWKIKTKFVYGETPEFVVGDTVTVVDPKSSLVTRSRIMETRLAYSGDKLTSDCYLGKTRANLVPSVPPIYRIATLSAPISLVLAATEKGLVAIVPKPPNSSLWALTELYVKTATGVTAIAELLVARKRATTFQLQGLLPKTRYYLKARYVDTYGRNTDLSVEVTRETLKFSTPFEDMQPADTDPATLAFQTENGNFKVFNDGSIEAENGIFSGKVSAGSLIPFTNISNGLGQSGDNTNFTDTSFITTASYFPTGSYGSFGVSGSVLQTITSDEYIPVDTTKLYTFSIWLKATGGFHYIGFACYDGDKALLSAPSGTYNYISYGVIGGAGTWYRETIGGGEDDTDFLKFREGTKFIRILLLFNYNHDAFYEAYLAGMSLKEATPFGESADAGVAFETASQSVQILDDGTIKAVSGEFSGSITGSTITGSTVEAQDNLSIKPDAEWVIEPVTYGTTSTLSSKNNSGTSVGGVAYTLTTSFSSIMKGTIQIQNRITPTGVGSSWGGQVEIEVNSINVYTSGYSGNLYRYDSKTETTNISIEAGDTIDVKNVKTVLATSAYVETLVTIKIDESLGSIADSIIGGI